MRFRRDSIRRRISLGRPNGDRLVLLKRRVQGSIRLRNGRLKGRASLCDQKRTEQSRWKILALVTTSHRHMIEHQAQSTPSALDGINNPWLTRTSAQESTITQRQSYENERQPLGLGQKLGRRLKRRWLRSLDRGTISTSRRSRKALSMVSDLVRE
jgi:hypothetical protein